MIDNNYCQLLPICNYSIAYSQNEKFYRFLITNIVFNSANCFQSHHHVGPLPRDQVQALAGGQVCHPAHLGQAEQGRHQDLRYVTQPIWD